MVQPAANGFFGLACFRTFNRHGRADCPLQLFHVSCKTLVTAAGLRYTCVAVGRHRSPGNRVTFRKDMLRSPMRRRRLRPAFCRTGHSQQSADDVRLKHPGRQNVPEPRLPGALIGILPRHKPARRRVGRSLPLGRREIREQSPSRQLRLSATDASYRSGWKQMQLAVNCGLRTVPPPAK